MVERAEKYIGKGLIKVHIGEVDPIFYEIKTIELMNLSEVRRTNSHGIYKKRVISKLNVVGEIHIISVADLDKEEEDMILEQAKQIIAKRL